MPFSSPLPTIVSVYNSAVPVSVVNSFTVETVILSPYIVPAGYLGIADSLLITVNFKALNGGLGSPSFKIRLGGLTGTIIANLGPTGTSSTYLRALFQNKGAINSNLNSYFGNDSSVGLIGPKIAQLSLDTTVSLAVVSTVSFSNNDGLSTLTLLSTNIQVIRA